MKWILVFRLCVDGCGATSAEFNTEQACRAASTASRGRSLAPTIPVVHHRAGRDRYSLLRVDRRYPCGRAGHSPRLLSHPGNPRTDRPSNIKGAVGIRLRSGLLGGRHSIRSAVGDRSCPCLRRSTGFRGSAGSNGRIAREDREDQADGVSRTEGIPKSVREARRSFPWRSSACEH